MYEAMQFNLYLCYLHMQVSKNVGCQVFNYVSAVDFDFVDFSTGCQIAYIYIFGLYSAKCWARNTTFSNGLFPTAAGGTDVTEFREMGARTAVDE